MYIIGIDTQCREVRFPELLPGLSRTCSVACIIYDANWNMSVVTRPRLFYGNIEEFRELSSRR